MVVGIVDAAADELICLDSGRRTGVSIVFAVPFIVARIARTTIATHSVVSSLVCAAERAEYVFIDSRLRIVLPGSPFRVVSRELHVELRDQFAPRGDAGVDPGGAVRMGVLHFLCIRQVFRLHQEEAELRVRGLEGVRHGVGVRRRGGGDVGQLGKRSPGVFVRPGVVRAVCNVEPVRSRAAPSEGERVRASFRCHVHRRRIVGIHLQKVAQLHAGAPVLVDAADVVVRKAARPEGEVVNRANEMTTIVGPPALPDAERVAAYKRETAQRSARPAERSVAAALIDGDHALVSSRDRVERPDATPFALERLDVDSIVFVKGSVEARTFVFRTAAAYDRLLHLCAENGLLGGIRKTSAPETGGSLAA